MLSASVAERPPQTTPPISIGNSGEAREILRRLEKRPSSLAPRTNFDELLEAPAQQVRPNRKARRAGPTIRLGEFRFAPPKPIEKRAVERLQALTLKAAEVAMYLDETWREGLHRQLEFLLDPAEWPEDAPLPEVDSYQSFLRAVILLRPHKRPSLGVSDFGNLVATWDSGDGQIFIEFHPNNAIRWSAAQTVDNRLQVASGKTVTSSLADELAGYLPDRWFASLAR